MMERRVLDTLEARRMVLVGSWNCGRMEKNMVSTSYFENDEDEEKETYHPPPSTPIPIPIPIPTNPAHHRKNPIQHHNPHRSPHQSLQTSHIEMRIPNREEIYVGSL